MSQTFEGGAVVSEPCKMTEYLNASDRKVVIIGNIGTGKTSILARQLNKSFRDKQPATVGVMFSLVTVTLPNEVVNIQVWDTSGDERFFSVTRLFYRRAAGAFLVFDVTSKITLERLSTWHKEVKHHLIPPGVLFVVGNKTDLVSEREVAWKDGADFAKSIGAEYLEVSALKNEGIEELFEACAYALSQTACGEPEERDDTIRDLGDEKETVTRKACCGKS